MTVHKSKGLKFEVVIFLAIEDQTFWSDIASERSIFFVGVSRAKKHLVLTVANHRDKPPGVAAWRWRENRTEQEEFIAYAESDEDE